MNYPRNLNTLAPDLAVGILPYEYSWGNSDDWRYLAKVNSLRLGKFYQYTYDRLHVNPIVDIHFYDDTLTIIMNDYCTKVIAQELIQKLELPGKPAELFFPIALQFKGNVELEYNAVKTRGELVLIEPVYPEDFNSLEIVSIDESSIKVAMHFWRKTEPGVTVEIDDETDDMDMDLSPNALIVVVSAAQIDVIEQQDDAWHKIFENEFDGFYKRFKKKLGYGWLAYYEMQKMVKSFQRTMNRQKKA